MNPRSSERKLVQRITASDLETKSIKSKSLIADLSSKYAEKPWGETLQLVRRCMDKTRGNTRPCEPIIRCLQKLHKALKVHSVSGMVSRLEMIAKQKGLGSHLSPTETACYLTADLFYLEVLLLPGGMVEDVKIAQHGESPVSSECLLQLLRSKKFEDFSLKLDDLASLYNIPGDNETKIKVYKALQLLGKDLLKISYLPRALRERDLHVDMILNGRIGNATLGGGGIPMSIQYYISPSDILMEMSNPDECRGGQVALVTVGSSDTTHRLQMESLIPVPPQINSQGFPEFSPLSEVPSESLPACFLLKLQPALPILSSVINRMCQITDVVISEADLQWAPFPQLLMRTTLGEKGGKESWKDKDAHFVVPLPGSEVHSYVLPGAEWSTEGAWKAALMHTIPFTHPAHVPALLELLRHQSALNVLLASCITSHSPRPGLLCNLHCEVLPQSDTSLSVTFHLPPSDSLAVLQVTVVDCRHVSCQLFLPELTDHSLDEYISRVLTRCMSIPITLRATCKRLANKTTTGVYSVSETANDRSMYPPRPETCESERAPAAHPSVAFSQNAVEDDAPPSPPTYYVMSVAASQAVNDANTGAPANPYLCALASVGVYSHWSANGSVTELV